MFVRLTARLKPLVILKRKINIMTYNVNMHTLRKFMMLLPVAQVGLFTKGDGWREVLDLGETIGVLKINQDKLGEPSPGLFVWIGQSL